MIRRGSKYKNRHMQVDGLIFDSIREANRYAELKLLTRAGEIRDLVADKRLLRFAMVINGLHICDYEADFKYTLPDGTVVVEDTKNPYLRKEAQYVIKKKLLYALHGLQITEV